MKLYDTILTANPPRRNHLTGNMFDAADMLHAAVRYNIFNVALYYWQNDKTFWDIAETAHFPSLAPPHPVTWLEYKMPTRFIMESGERYRPELAKEIAGCLMIAIDRNDTDQPALFDPYTDSTRWLLEGHMFISPAQGRPKNRTHQALVTQPNGFLLPVAGDGSLGAFADGSGPFRVAIPPTAPDQALISSAIAQHSKPFLLTFSFLSCNNVLIVDHDPRPKRKRNRSKKPRRKAHSYRTLEIRPLKDVLRVRGKKRGKSGRKLSSVSITRGHFRTYTESGKLFGKYTGRFWIPSHVKGRGRDKQRDRDIKI